MRLVISILLIFLLALSAKGLDPVVNISDSGFRPEVNGFSFENYGNENPTVGLTPVEMQRMFGERVCSSTAGGKCILSPPAGAWMEEANKAMDYGHCEGMAVLSTLMYYNQTLPSMFGGSEADRLSIQNDLLQREIAYWWATQVTTPGRSHKVNDSANAVLDTLVRAFKDGQKATEWWTLGLYQPDGYGGHAITPYAVENMSNGTAKILVYDNNFPNITRSVEIDRIANTWKYHTSANPNEPSELYAGNASTKNLEVVSVPPRVGVQNCEFCGDNSSSSLGNTKGALSRQNRIQFWVDGNAKLLITDASGKRVGYLDSGQFINEIPSAEALHLEFSSNPGVKRHEPIIFVPQGNQISALLTCFETGEIDLTVIGSNYYVRVHIKLIRDEQIKLAMTTFENDYYAELLPIGLKSPRTTTFSIGVNAPLESHWFTIQDAEIEPEGSLGLHLDLKKGIFAFNTHNKNPFGLKLLLKRVSHATGNEQIFTNYDYTINKNDEINIDLNRYDGNSYWFEVHNGNLITKRVLHDNPNLHPEKLETSSPTMDEEEGKIFEIEQKCPLSCS